MFKFSGTSNGKFRVSSAAYNTMTQVSPQRIRIKKMKVLKTNQNRHRDHQVHKKLKKDGLMSLKIDQDSDAFDTKRLDGNSASSIVIGGEMREEGDSMTQKLPA